MELEVVGVSTDIIACCIHYFIREVAKIGREEVGKIKCCEGVELR
jgi:hypothetical protein